MLEGLLHLFAHRRWTEVLVDAVDIAFVTYVVYRALLVVRGTRAMQMGTGLLVMAALYVGAKWAGLATLFSVLSSLLSSIILIVVVVFQNDIRRGLIRVGERAFLGGLGRGKELHIIDEVVAAANELARHRMGALICFEQDANLDEFVVGQGTVLDAQVQRDLLVGLFVPESVNKLHDGAVVIRNYRIAKAGVFFPMPDTKIHDRSLGSRHRAALGITEETDCIVIVVSEERGTISFCFNGNIVSGLDGPSLKEALIGLSGGAPGRGTPKKPAEKIDARKTRPTPIATPAQPLNLNLNTPASTRSSNPPPLAHGLANFRSSMPPPPPMPEESLPVIQPAEPKTRPLAQSRMQSLTGDDDSEPSDLLASDDGDGDDSDSRALRGSTRKDA